MAVTPLADGQYPEPAISRSSSGSGLWRVLLLALFFIGVAVVFSTFGDRLPENMVLLFLGLLSVIGVFCLFAIAAGLFRIAGGREKRTINALVVDSLPYGAAVTDREGKIYYANAKYAEFAGDVGGGLPVSVPRLFASVPEASEAIYRLTRAAREGRHVAEDIRLLRPLIGKTSESGSAYWYRLSVRPLPTGDVPGKPLVQWSVEDISRDRSNQENVFIELQRAIDYLDHAPAGFFSANSRGAVQYINSTLADWLNFDLAEFEPGSLTLEEIVRGDGASLLMGGRPGSDLQTETIDIDLVRQDGTSFPVRLLHRAARLAEGELGETRTLVLDRTRAESSEEALRAVEVKFSRFFNDTPFAIATLDDLGRVVHTNAPFTRIFGLQAGEQSIEQMPIFDLMHEDGREDLETALEAALANKSDIEPVNLTVKGGGDRAVRLFVSASEPSDRSKERVIIYALDTTDQRKLEAQFAQGQKMQAVGQLAGGIAHDFNNVLTAIIGFSDLLLLKHKPGDPSFGDIMSIKQSANRAAALVRQLLAFSRRQTLRPQVLEIQPHIEELKLLLRRLIGERIVLDVPPQQGIWPVRVDLVQLEQVIINLVVNARDAMPEGGTITIVTRNVTTDESEDLDYRGMPAGDYVLIDVSDTGTGMPPETMAKIFEPFFSTKELGKGTGLGLSMVYGIIKQTGGFIYPESEIGNGTTFHIFLPRHFPEEGDVAPVAAVVSIRDLTGHERILLVEDEESVRSFSARALSTTGYEVFEAASGEEALEVLEEIGYELDLLVTDVVMPEMDGPTLLRKVRERLPGLKVILVSGYAEESIRKDIEDDRSVEFLAKPYTLDQINSKVKEVLSASDDPADS